MTKRIPEGFDRILNEEFQEFKVKLAERCEQEINKKCRVLALAAGATNK